MKRSKGDRLLGIDVGNTHIAVGVFQGKKLIGEGRFSTNAEWTADQYGLCLQELFASRGIPPASFARVILSCVRPPLEDTFRELSRKYFGKKPLVVNAALVTGLRIGYRDPKQLGADRIANAVAARSYYGDAVVIVDFGTATTFCAVVKGEYRGGIIAPGVGVSMDALLARASLLPRVELNPPEELIGRDTVTSIQSGFLYGFADMVDGLVKRMKKDIGAKVKTVATGGWAKTVVPFARSLDESDPQLTLKGLRLLADLNP